MMRRSALVLGAALITGIAVAGALQQERSQLHVAAGAVPLCTPGAELGRVRVRMEFAWRADQKERALREAIALRAVHASFADLPCAREVEVVATGDDAASAARADVEVAIRIHELGPNLVLTLFPPQWLGWTQVDAQVRAVRVADGAVLLDAHVSREQGGPFALRGTEPLMRELTLALTPLVRDAL